MTIKKSSFIYLGPDRPFGQPLMQNAILAGEPEDVLPALETLFPIHKNFRKLFVPISELAKARAALRQPGSPLCKYVEEIRTASNNLKKK